MSVINLGLVTLWTSKISGWCLRHANDKASYCRKWKFRFYGYDRILEPSRAPTWSKIIALRKNLAKHDWLLWLDADAVITNFDFDARDLCDDAFDMIITHDHGGFNAGIFLIRNTPICEEFLERVWAHNISVHHYEQTAMIEIMKQMPDLRVKVIPKRLMNSYWFDHRHGDFIFHAAGQTNAEKSERMAEFANAGIRPAPTLTSVSPDTIARKLTLHDQREAGSRQAVISCCLGGKNAKYWKLVELWAAGVRNSGWDGDLVLYTNRYLEVSVAGFAQLYSLVVLPASDPAGRREPYLFKAEAALRALKTYDEILFTDVDVVIRRNPSEWAFSHDRMMVSPDVFHLFHPCMLGQWYQDKPKTEYAGANSGIWSVARKHSEHSLKPWYREMRSRIENNMWPSLLNDQPVLNRLWHANQIEMGLFDPTSIAYPSTAGWVGNGAHAWAVHCCGVDSAQKEMKKAIGTGAFLDPED